VHHLPTGYFVIYSEILYQIFGCNSHLPVNATDPTYPALHDLIALIIIKSQSWWPWGLKCRPAAA